MFHKFLSHVFSIPLILFAFNINAQSIRWELNNSPIFIDSNVVVMAGDVLSIDAGTEIQFAQNVALNVEGEIEIIGQGEVTLTSFSSEKWQGLSVKSDEVFTLSNLHISNASIGIKLTSSPNVTVSSNILDNNDTGISLHADDGARSNVNSITSNVIQNNDIGLSATSTGADIQNNLIANNRSYGINLSGRSCGGGTACGWQSL
ncbi:MAG: parallel beta-helix repeat protein, partial [Paraglaciecola sp.]